MPAEPVKIGMDSTTSVSGLMEVPKRPSACCVLAHGAGAGMTHPFMEATAKGLGNRAIATLRYQFPFMDQGSRRPDRPAPAQATVRAAVETAAGLMPGVPLFAGGKSFGARMTSQAQVEAPLTGVRGLVFLGFPLHPAGKPSDERARHLSEVHIPMLFLQGTRDTLATMPLLAALANRLGTRATLITADDADHSFHVPKRSGKTDQRVLDEMLDALTDWISAHLAGE